MLYAIAGNGEGPVKEITAALKDLKDKATQDDGEFWIVMEGKDEPTKTDQAIVKWLTAQEVWFEVYTSTGTTIEGAQETNATDDVFAAMMERIQERAAESEEAALLVLLTDDEDEDEALGTFVEQAADADIPVFQLNGQMAQISLEEDEPEAADDPEPPAPVKAAAKKAAAKKAAAPAAAAPTKKAVAKKAAAPAAEEQDGAPNDDDDETAEAVVYTPEELAKMSVAELGAVARGQGIDPKGLGKRDLISAIEAKLRGEPEAVGPVASALNGDGGALIVIHLPGGTIITKAVTEAAALAIASS